MRIRHLIAGVLIPYIGYNICFAALVGLGDGDHAKFVWWAHAPIKGFIWGLNGGFGAALLVLVIAAVVFGIIVACCNAPARVQPRPRHLGVPPVRR